MGGNRDRYVGDMVMVDDNEIWFKEVDWPHPVYVETRSFQWRAINPKSHPASPDPHPELTEQPQPARRPTE